MTILDDPMPEITISPSRAIADKALLLNAVLAEPAGLARRVAGVTPRAAVAGLVGAAVVVGGAASAAAVLSHERPTVFDLARCYTEATTNFGDSFPGTSITVLNPYPSSAPVDVPDQARSVCGALWRQGLLQYGAAGIGRPGTGTHGNVPSLAVCVLPSGEAAVFPGGSTTCRRLGLPDMTPAGRSAVHDQG